jgi:hypothetical protein
MFDFLHNHHCDLGICPVLAQAWRSLPYGSRPPVHLTSPYLFLTFSCDLAHIFLYWSWSVTVSPNIMENFMKLINSESPVFSDVSINPILVDDRRESRSRLIIHICPFPSQQTTALTYIPLVDDIFTYTSTSWRCESFSRSKSNHRKHLSIVEISDSRLGVPLGGINCEDGVVRSTARIAYCGRIVGKL